MCKQSKQLAIVCKPAAQRGEMVVFGRFLVVLFFTMCACVSSEHELRSGLKIENEPNRGLNYTDPQGTKYSYRYIPITITNDSLFPIQIQIALSGEYDYPAVYGDQKFKVFLVPRELKADQITYDTSTYELGNNRLRDFFDRGLNPKYVLNETLKPGEKCEITMGTLYPRPTNCGYVPNVLFLGGDIGNFQKCDDLISQGIPSVSDLGFGLKVDFCSGCILIPCGNVKYSTR